MTSVTVRRFEPRCTPVVERLVISRVLCPDLDPVSSGGTDVDPSGTENLVEEVTVLVDVVDVPVLVRGRSRQKPEARLHLILPHGVGDRPAEDETTGSPHNGKCGNPERYQRGRQQVAEDERSNESVKSPLENVGQGVRFYFENGGIPTGGGPFGVSGFQRRGIPFTGKDVTQVRSGGARTPGETDPLLLRSLRL